jgi:hypothetical protein
VIVLIKQPGIHYLLLSEGDLSPSRANTAFIYNELYCLHLVGYSNYVAYITYLLPIGYLAYVAFVGYVAYVASVASVADVAYVADVGIVGWVILIRNNRST